MVSPRCPQGLAAGAGTAAVGVGAPIGVGMSAAGAGAWGGVADAAAGCGGGVGVTGVCGGVKPGSKAASPWASYRERCVGSERMP